MRFERLHYCKILKCLEAFYGFFPALLCSKLRNPTMLVNSRNILIFLQQLIATSDFHPLLQTIDKDLNAKARRASYADGVPNGICLCHVQSRSATCSSVHLWSPKRLVCYSIQHSSLEDLGEWWWFLMPSMQMCSMPVLIFIERKHKYLKEQEIISLRGW
jgi:hypothetical protein